jgi:DNA-binding response OmpR family regulator
MLPGMSGLDVCKRLRENFINTPILMLTARDSVNDIIIGFDAGADDYLVKPFDLGVLEARIKAIYKRKYGLVSGKELSFGELKLDIHARTLHRNGDSLPLNKTLFKLLKLLLQKAPEVATRAELIRELWPDDEPDEDLLRNQVYRLRNLVDKPYSTKYIQSVPKVGYQLKQSN